MCERLCERGCGVVWSRIVGGRSGRSLSVDLCVLIGGRDRGSGGDLGWRGEGRGEGFWERERQRARGKRRDERRGVLGFLVCAVVGVDIVWRVYFWISVFAYG